MHSKYTKKMAEIKMSNSLIYSTMKKGYFNIDEFF